MTETPTTNKDRELWREVEGDAYSPSIFVTVDGGIGIDVGGMVHVMTLRRWHRLAAEDFKSWATKPTT